MTIAAKIPLQSAEQETARVRWMGSEYSLTLRGNATTGAAGAFESVVQPGDGPPIHIHHREDEIVHVIEGRFEFFLDGELIPRRTGDTMFLPRGVPHSFRVLGDRPGRLLALLMPGGFEGFFLEAARRDLRIPEDMEAVNELAARYGLEFTGPPLSAMAG